MPVGLRLPRLNRQRLRRLAGGTIVAAAALSALLFILSPGAADRTGVRRQVFPDVGFNGTPLLDDVGTTIILDFLNDDPDLPRRFFSVRWTGYWYAPEAGDVELHGAGERREYNTVRPHSALGYRPPAPKAISPTPRSGLIMSPALS